MAKTKRTTYQQNARAAEQAQQPSHGSRNRLLIVILALIIFALVIILIVVLTTRNNVSNPPTPSQATSAVEQTTEPADTSTSPASTASVTQNQINPPHGDPSMGWMEIKADNVKPDALTVDEHFDFQCPWCAIAEDNFGESFIALAERGDIVYRVHIRTLIGDQVIGNDSSEKAAVAATCADTVGKFLEYTQTVFENQPEEGVGFTDQQLSTDFANQAGISGGDLDSFQSCYATQATLNFVTGMEQTNQTSRSVNYGVDMDPVLGTPTFFINGKSLGLNAIMNAQPPYSPSIDASPDGLLAVLQSIATS